MKEHFLTKPLMVNFKYGDIILLDFNPVRGAEIAKIRPCILVSHDFLNKHSPLYVVVPITSNTQRVMPFQLVIEQSPENGLRLKSKAVPEHIKSVDKSRSIKKIGTLEEKYLIQLEEKIAFVLNQINLLL